MRMTLEEAVKHAEYIVNNRKDAISVCWSVKDCKQIAEWLRELQERRKAPEIIRCKDCKHYEWMSNRIPEEQTWHCHCWDADTGKDDFCSYAEKRHVEDS